MVNRVMTDKVPERPSTPSEQFVTLIETKIRMVARITKRTGCMVTGLFTKGISKVEELKLT
ncbi:hypothetical protein D3C81_2001360 [compost metagenome]